MRPLTCQLVAVAIVAAANSECTRARDNARGEAPTASGHVRVPDAAIVWTVPSGPTPRASAAPSVMHTYDAGVNACRLTWGPGQLPFVGEVALAPDDVGILVVTHRDGVPTVTRIVADVDAAAPSTDDAGLPRVSAPPCVVAGESSLCMDPAGAIHERRLLSEGRDTVVARARPGTSFAAERAFGSHLVVAYLADRRTTEGIVSEAYATLDGGPPVRISEEGSGTTYLALARRGPLLLSLLLDGRVAMTPVHARAIAVVDGTLRAGADAVVFVGGGAEPSTRGALGVDARGVAFGFVPIAAEPGFGLVTVRIDDPPRVDEATTFSPYLNGLDPAPIAATRGVDPIRIARVRPLEARADSPRGLELGAVDDAGKFVSYGLVGSKGRVKSAALAVDRTGALWLAFTDGSGTWLERRACP